MNIEVNNVDYNIGACNPTQIVNINTPVQDASTVNIKNECNEFYDQNSLLWSYSVDSVCWSCYMSYENLLKNTFDIEGDFYVKAKINDVVSGVNIDGEDTDDYTTQLSSDFQLTTCSTGSSNTFNPYANLDDAINLQSQLTETVSCLFGIPCYYFKLKPDSGSKDITFKEYALMNVDSVKQIKILITDGTMPSSKPEFNDFGLDFQTDWETEISKATFATAFGNTAQPTEGDFIYIPMMKRMWMVTGAYEEKNGSLMWNATTFKVMLVKYQEKGSVDLKDTEELVNTLVKNKYDDLFGDDERSTYDAGTHYLDAPISATNNLYSVYESDAMRKYVTCDTVSFNSRTTYYKGTVVSDYEYTFMQNNLESKVIYQKKYCGSSAAISFILTPQITTGFRGCIFSNGKCEVYIDQEIEYSYLYTNIYPDDKITLVNGSTYFIILRWDLAMNIFEFTGYEYTYDKRIPEYKLLDSHYYYDIDNPVKQYVERFTDELIDDDGHDVYISNFIGTITNIKLFDIYNDNVSELLQMYPNHQHLMINDTARRITGNSGVFLR